MVIKQLLRTETLTHDNGHTLVLRYYVCEYAKTGLLAICVELDVWHQDQLLSSDEDTVVCEYTESRQIKDIIYTLAENTVTPITLRDIIHDMTLQMRFVPLYIA